MNWLRNSLLVALATALLAAGVMAHPSHTSFVEIGWSESGEQLEVALRVIPEDLEEVLAAQQGRHVTLMDSPAVRNMVTLWLNDEFRVYAGGTPLPVTVLGMELESYRASWVFFTIDAPQEQALSLATITQRVAAVMRRNPEKPVLVWGDEAVPYGEVVTVMVALQQAGAPSVGLVTETP